MKEINLDKIKFCKSCNFLTEEDKCMLCGKKTIKYKFVKPSANGDGKEAVMAVKAKSKSKKKSDLGIISDAIPEPIKAKEAAAKSNGNGWKPSGKPSEKDGKKRWPRLAPKFTDEQKQNIVTI